MWEQKLVTEAVVARRCQTNGWDVPNTSYQTEPGSVAFLQAASGILATCKYWSITQVMQGKKETTQVLLMFTFAENSRWRVTRLEDVCVAHSYTQVHHSLHTCTDTDIYTDMEYSLGHISKLLIGVEFQLIHPFSHFKIMSPSWIRLTVAVWLRLLAGASGETNKLHL